VGDWFMLLIIKVSFDPENYYESAIDCHPIVAAMIRHRLQEDDFNILNTIRIDGNTVRLKCDKSPTVIAWFLGGWIGVQPKVENGTYILEVPSLCD
jgi:hypothetical protein